MKIQFAELQSTYNSTSFSVPTATTDLDVKSTVSGSFWYQGNCTWMRLTTDQTITVKLNSTANPWIIITSSESPFVLSQQIAISNVYISNVAGTTASVKLLLTA